jgi:hypothetical protein
LGASAGYKKNSKAINFGDFYFDGKKIKIGPINLTSTLRQIRDFNKSV